ncbi:MAG: BlaI/MecI/CopY family transcriptional regulator [Candidatus Methanofastidiosia archaeon]
MVVFVFEWHEFRPFEKGYKKVLGPLETEIMEIIWNNEIETAKGVFELLKKEKREIRRSTISIMMNRLCERRLIHKKIDKGRGGLKYVYTINITQREFEKEVVKKVVDALLDTFPTETLDYIKDLTD